MQALRGYGANLFAPAYCLAIGSLFVENTLRMGAFMSEDELLDDRREKEEVWI